MLTLAAQLLGIVFLAALFAVIAFRLLSGSINTRGLLTCKETREFSPGRLQLLLATIGGAAFYLFKILGATGHDGFPPVPEDLLLVLGASNAGYLGAKIYARFFAPRRDPAL